MRPDLSKPVPGRSGWRASQRIRLSLLLACCAALALWFAAARTGALGHASAGTPCPFEAALRPGGYEMRWWAPNRDDVVADVLRFSGPAQARLFLARAVSARCRDTARLAPARWPAAARNLRWINPDAFAQADVMFARGPRVYRVAIVQPGRAAQAPTPADLRRFSRRRHPRLSAARRRLRDRRGVHAGMRATRAFSGFGARGALLAVSVLLAASALLAGCGGSQGGSTGSATSPGSDAAGGGKRPAGRVAIMKTATEPTHRPRRGISAARASGPISVAAAEAFAHAINLTVSDIPGATARKRESHSESPREKQREKRALAKCLGAEPVHEIVDVKSPQLDRGVGIEGESFTSSVTVVAHPVEAEREIAAVRRFGGQPCLARLLRRRLLDKSLGRARLGPVRISLLHPRVAAAAASAGLRIEITLLTARGTSIPLYTDELAFALGCAEVQLGAYSVAQPVASTTEQELLSLLSQRARAHPL